MRWWRSTWSPVALAALPVLATVWAASVPGGYFGIVLVAAGLWAAVGLVAIVVGVVGLVALPRPRRRHLGRLAPLLLVPALLVGAGVLSRSGAVADAVFAAHRDGLERLAGDVPSRGALTDRQVGLLSISTASKVQGCAVLTIADAGFLDSAGYAHCPGTAPVSASGEGYRFTPLDGAWYEFRFSW